MDSITDYDTLVTAVNNLVKRDVGDSVDGFIRMCERELDHRLDTSWQQHEVVKQASDGIVDLPTEDAEGDQSILGIARVVVSNKLIDRLDHAVAVRRFENQSAGQIQYFSVVGGRDASPYSERAIQAVYLWPTPDGSTDVSLTVKRQIDPLLGTGESNWVIDIAPQLYLYGTAKYAAVFARDQEGTNLFSEMFEQNLAAFIDATDNYQTPQRTNFTILAGGYECQMP